MSVLEYASVPQCATEIQPEEVRTKSKLVSSTPKLPASIGPDIGPTASGQPSSPTKQHLNLPHLLLSSSLNLPNLPPTSPRDGSLLLSTREPLSLQITTANFRRFVSKSGPIFWLQDRIEEIVMWRKGWKVTCTWMAIYTFLCYFPRMFLLLPHIILISVLLSTHAGRHRGVIEPPGPAQQPKEGTVDWYANLQAIQNLMGAISDLYDAGLIFLPTLTWAAPHTPQLLTLSCASLFLLIPIAVVIPLRSTLLFMGLFPLTITHPVILRLLPTVLRPFMRMLQSRAQRVVDNDNLPERQWFADMREVELWENERWTSTGWSKSNLKTSERKPWTRGRDGWSDAVAGGNGDVNNLTFTISPGYEFVETEDWRVDREGRWEETGVDDYGWMYTNDSWLDPRPAPLEEWKAQGMTRRRRWIRRIYLSN